MYLFLIHPRRPIPSDNDQISTGRMPGFVHHLSLSKPDVTQKITTICRQRRCFCKVSLSITKVLLTESMVQSKQSIVMGWLWKGIQFN